MVTGVSKPAYYTQVDGFPAVPSFAVISSPLTENKAAVQPSGRTLEVSIIVKYKFGRTCLDILENVHYKFGLLLKQQRTESSELRTQTSLQNCTPNSHQHTCL